MAVDAAGLAAHQLRHVRVLLLRHDRGAGAEAVREVDEAEARAHPQDQLLATGATGASSTSAAAAANSIAKSRSRHRVERVVRDAVEAEFARDHVRGRSGRWCRRARPRPAAARLTRRRQSASRAAVALEHLVIGEQVMAEGHRLRDLQVGEARHDRLGVALRQREQRLLERDPAARAIASIASRSHRRTSVATWSLRERAVCSRLPASPTSSVRRRSMLRCTSSRSSDHCELPGADLVADLRQPRSMAVRSARRSRRRRQHARVRQRALDVVRRQALVEADRGGVALHERIHRFGEAAGPGLASSSAAGCRMRPWGHKMRE